jgi:proteasome lid subunit RPN8/RPN11
MVQQLAMFDKQMNDTIFSGKVVPVTRPEPMDYLPQSFDSNVVDVFAHVNNGAEKRDKSPPKTAAQANGDLMVAVRPKKEVVKENKQEKLGPPPSYDSLIKIVEEKKQEQKAAVTTPVPAPVKQVTPAALKTPAVNPSTPVVQPNVTAVQNQVPQQPAPVVKDNKEQLLAAAKAKADKQQLDMMLGAQPSAPPMENPNKGTEVFSELRNFIEESKSAPKSISSAFAEPTKPIGNSLSNLVKDNNPSLYNFPRVEEAAMPVLPKVVENKDKKEKKPKSKDKHRTKSPKSSNDTSNAVPKDIQVQLEQQKQQIEMLQQQVSEQSRLQQQYVQYYQLMQQLYGVQQHPHDHSGHDHSHSHGSNSNSSGAITAKVVSNPTTAPKQAPLPVPQALPQPQSKTITSPSTGSSRMQPLPPPAAKLPSTAANQLVPQHAPLAMPQSAQSGPQLQQLQQQLQQAQSPFPVIYGVPVVFRPYNLNLPTATNAVKTLGLNKQQQLQYQEQQFQNIYQTNKTGGIAPNLQITAEAPVKEPAKPKQPEKVPEIIKKKPAKLIGGLRPMEVDGELFNSFMDHAEPNTSRGVETCGILCGVLDEINEVFQVTCLMIPKQVGTSDTCATTDEEEIFDFQMKNDLLTLGWIHTHPTQSCFLSSVDLHTQCSYQSLFPEAIAVVIAPKFNPNFNIFNLTDRGLGFVQRCPRSGFHYHEESDLYNTSDHVKIRWGKKKYKVVDMRKRSYGR